MTYTSSRIVSSIRTSLLATAPLHCLVQGSQRSLYLSKRFLRVVIYHIYKRIRQTCSNIDDTIISKFVMDWEFFLEVRHESMAQLLSDGVPPGKIPAKGVNNIVYIWDHNRQRIKDGDCLPKWTYGPTLDRPRDISSEAVTYF